MFALGPLLSIEEIGVCVCVWSVRVESKGVRMPQIIQFNWPEKYPTQFTATNFVMLLALCWPSGAFFSFLVGYVTGCTE